MVNQSRSRVFSYCHLVSLPTTNSRQVSLARWFFGERIGLRGGPQGESLSVRSRIIIPGDVVAALGFEKKLFFEALSSAKKTVLQETCILSLFRAQVGITRRQIRVSRIYIYICIWEISLPPTNRIYDLLICQRTYFWTRVESMPTYFANQIWKSRCPLPKKTSIFEKLTDNVSARHPRLL